ncbi:MAG: type II toxin-antitoxin system RelE family toxin [Bryobacteraceae bacterium]
MNYQVFFSSHANKERDALDPRMKRRVEDHLRMLSLDPWDSRLSRPLKGARGTRRSRVGDWRIVYYPDSDLKHLIVERVGHRREVYRGGPRSWLL